MTYCFSLYSSTIYSSIYVKNYVLCPTKRNAGDSWKSSNSSQSQSTPNEISLQRFNEKSWKKYFVVTIIELETRRSFKRECTHFSAESRIKIPIFIFINYKPRLNGLVCKNLNGVQCGAVVGLQSLTCDMVKHRPASLDPGWVTTKDIGNESLSWIKNTCFSRTNRNPLHTNE